jgi:outer membrane protein
MKNKILIISVGAIVFVLSAGWSLWTKGPDLVYVDNVKLFNDFEMSKEFNGKLESVAKLKQNQLDSLKFKLDALDLKFKSGNRSDSLIMKFKLLKMEFDDMSERYNNEYEMAQSQYNAQIWKQLDQYIKEYSKEENIDIVVGASGDGTVMYGNDKYEITNELLQYANVQYSGNTR